MRLEAFVDLILLRQPLYDANGGQCFLRQGSQQSRADASFARCALDQALVPINDPEHERGDRERSEREPPVQPEHQRSHAAQQQRVAGESDDAAANKVLNGLNVGGQPASQVAGLLRVVKTQGQPLHVREQVPPQLKDEALADIA